MKTARPWALTALAAAAAFALSAVASQANQFANPGFESGLDSWITFGNALQSSTPHSGAHSLVLSGYSPGSFNACGAYQILPASPGQRWTVSGYGLNDPANPLLGGNYALLKIVWFDGTNGTGNELQPLPGAGTIFGANPGIESAQLDYFTPTNSWLPLSVSGVAPPGTRSVQLFGGLFLQVNQAPGAALFDDLTAEITKEWGNALSFDGVDEYVVFDRPVSDDFTLECWIRSTQQAGPNGQWWEGMGLIDGEVSGLNNDFGLSLGAGRVLFGTGGSQDVTIRSGSVADRRWHHVAATRERSSGVMKLYVDGWLVDSGTNGTGALDAPAQMRLGSLATGIHYFQGEMDDVRIWNVVRSQAEIQDGMDRPLSGQEPNLVAYWNLDEGSGGTAYDATTNAHNANVTNSTAWVASGVTRNLALNPGFEDGTSGWSGFAWASVEPAWGLPPSGSPCAFVFNRTNDYSGIAQSFVGAFQPGIEYRISAWVRLENAASGPAYLTIQKTDGTDSTYQQVAGGTATSDAWTQLSGTYTLSVTGVLNALNLYMEGPGPGTNFYVDNFVVEPVTPLGTIDATVTHQTIEGFGGSIAFYNNWLTAHPYKQEIYTNIFSGLNLGILRIGNWFRYPTNAAFDLDTQEIVSNGNAILGRPLTLEMSSWSPPAFLKSNGETGNGGTLTNINGNFAYAQFADYWYDSLMWYKTNGIEPTYIGIQNEPDWAASHDSCVFHPAEDEVDGTNYASFALALDAVYQRLTNLPSPPKLLGPEVVGIGYNALQNYAATMNPNSFYGVAHHLYHGGDSSWADSFVPAMEGTVNVFPDKPKFQTEYGHGDMIQTALLIHHSLTVEEVSGYIFWSLVWPLAPEQGVSGPALVQQEYPWSTNYWTNAPPGCPTQSHGYWLTPQYYAMKHFSYFIEPGYRRVETPGTDSDIRLSAYLAPDNSRLVVVLINPKSTPYEGTLNLNGFEIGASEVYQTVGTNAETSQFASLGPVPPDLHGTLPGYSITTMVFQPRYAAANLTSLPASNLFVDTATLNGTVDPAGQDTTAWYEWGTSTAYGNSTAAIDVTNTATLSAPLSGLDPSLTYHYRLVASNRLGVAYGVDQVFSFPIIVLNGPDSLTNECHTPVVDPGAYTVQPAIAAGWMHSLALQADRTVVGWGDDRYGQTDTPLAATNVVAIAAGERHSLALRADGTVLGWGTNDYGQAMLIPGQGNVLSFDGTDDYVQAGAVPLANASFTVEAWARRDTTGTMDMIVAQGVGATSRGLMFGFHWNYIGFVFDFYGDGVTSLNIDNNWHHWAGTYDASTRVRCLYRDGVLLATNVALTNYLGSGPICIGREPFNDPANFAGAIDEVRIWNVARSQAQIQANMSHPLTGSESNLIAYWKFDETSGDIAYDSTTNHYDGTLVNGPVWTNRPADVMAIAAGYSHNLALRANGTVFGWGNTNYGCSSPPRMATNVVAISAGNEHSLALRADGTVVGWGYNQYGQATGISNTNWGNSLSFDGTDDYIIITNFGSAVPTNEVTVEFWQRVHAAKTQSTFSLDPDQLNNRFQAHVPWNNGYVFWDFGDINGEGRLSYQPESLVNSWQHFALVAKTGTGGYMKIYRNGVLEASKTNAGSPYFANHNLRIGMSPNSYFNGELDEFRIWNVARSQAEIQANLGHPLTGSESNLVAYWKFDEADGDIAYDSSGHGYDGTLVNGPVRTNLPLPSFGMVTVAGQPLTNVAAIWAGEWHSLALRDDGTVVGWGYNVYGQADSPANNSNFVAIAAGSQHSLALRTDGSVAAWGAGTYIGAAPHYGQSIVPAEATNVVAIAAGGWHSLALRADGTVLGWGAGTNNTGSGTSFGQVMIPELMMPAGLSVSAPVVSVSGIDTDTPGTNVWTYTTTNALGAVGTATRILYVVDTTPPVLTLLGANPLVHPYKAPFVDPGAVATDACSGNLGVTMVANTVDPEVLGAYSVTYRATDPAGNMTTTNRTVLVQTAPSFLPGDLDNNGVLDQAEFDTIAQYYWGSSSRPYMTNLLTDGEGLFQMTLTNAAAWNFSVEVSTNLVDWDYLCPAWPSLEFYDPQATNQPQRYYRLSWP